MDDLLCDFAQRTQFRVQQHVGLPVKRFARCEQFADFRLGVRIVEQGTMALISHTLPDFFRRSPKANDERMRFKSGEIFGIRRQTAARANHSFCPAGKFANNSRFKRAESLFTIGLENFRNRPAGARLNHFIRVEVIKTQLLGGKPSDGSFARAHETNERDVGDAAVALHENELTQFYPSRTLQILDVARCWQ
jgi:hypothetical protein